MPTKVPRQRDAFPLTQLLRDCELDLARDLGILTLLAYLG